MDEKVFLSDGEGRIFSNLRVSLLDACNFSCLYCSPDKKVVSQDRLSVEEIVRIVSNLMELGVEKVRLTGGEPTLRQDFEDIVLQLGQLGLKTFGITSHGATLGKYVDIFRKAKLFHINVSMDSLNGETFKWITKRDVFEKVKSNVIRLQETGDFKVKINCVLLKGVNTHEIDDFLEFSSRYGVEVRFLELMKIGVANRFYEQYFYPKKEIMSYLQSRYRLERKEVPPDSSSVIYRVEGGASIGYIASETEPFCGTCSRLRLTSRGDLNICLFKRDCVSLRGLSKEDYQEKLAPLLRLKPHGRIATTERMMYQIGG